MLLLVWPRFCWGRKQSQKPSQKQVLGSGTGFCWTSFPARLYLQSAKNCVVLLFNKPFLSFYISSPKNTPLLPSQTTNLPQKKTKAVCCSSLPLLGTRCQTAAYLHEQKKEK